MPMPDMPKEFIALSEAARDAGVLHGLVVAAGGSQSLDICWAWGDASVLPVRRPMAQDAIFDVASVTKAVATTSACALCIDRGLLDPDAPVAHYLPNIGQYADSPIRVRDLATHTSGYDNRKFDHLAPDALLRAIVETPAQWRPGERFEYACRNFLVLGRIVEQVSGEDLGTFCANNLFMPLGMRDSRLGPGYPPSNRLVPSSSPAGIISDEQARQAACPVGNAGLFSTAHDLATFCQMMLSGGKYPGGRLLQDLSIRWLTQPCNAPGLPRRAFGWDMRDSVDCPHRPSMLTDSAIGHSGWTGQSVWIDPGQGLYTIVMTNRTHAPRVANNYDDSRIFRARMGDLLISQLRALREK